MKAFVTGGTGFIGLQVIAKLLQRGDQVVALVRSENGAALLETLGVQPILGNILDRTSLKSGMVGCEVVYHIAGWYKLGSQDQSQAEPTNVQGTLNVLEIAWEMGIPRIVYTSTVAIFGDTHGAIVDETYQMPPGQQFITEYDRTKWKAYYEVVLPLIHRGAPVIIVQPGVVYGPGDQSLVGQLMQAYDRGWLLLFPGPETRLSLAYVEDVAEGHLLAAEKGMPGESYILAGPTLSLRQAVELWASITRKSMPWFFVPSSWIHPLEFLSRTLGYFLPLPELLSPDGIRVLGVSYAAHSDKARSHLGWETRPLESGFRDTFASYGAVRQSPMSTKPSTLKR